MKVFKSFFLFLDEIEIEKKYLFEIIFLGGGALPLFFCENLLVRLKLGHPSNFNFLEKSTWKEEERKKEECFD